jgi:hypothetical protein
MGGSRLSVKKQKGERGGALRAISPLGRLVARRRPSWAARLFFSFKTFLFLFSVFNNAFQQLNNYG